MSASADAPPAPTCTTKFVSTTLRSILINIFVSPSPTAASSKPAASRFSLCPSVFPVVKAFDFLVEHQDVLPDRGEIPRSPFSAHFISKNRFSLPRALFVQPYPCPCTLIVAKLTFIGMKKVLIWVLRKTARRLPEC